MEHERDRFQKQEVLVLSGKNLLVLGESGPEWCVFGAEAVLADAGEALVGELLDALEGGVGRLLSLGERKAATDESGGESPPVGGLSLAGKVVDLLEEGFDLVLVHGGLGWR